MRLTKVAEKRSFVKRLDCNCKKTEQENVPVYQKNVTFSSAFLSTKA